MIAIVTSDLHGCLPEITSPFDYLFICGDICPAHDHYFLFQDEWLKNEFCDWAKGLPYNDEASRVILVPGNHDFALERYKNGQKLCDGRVSVLKNDTCELWNGMKVFGTPYCKEFGNWAFMLSPEGLEKKYENCPLDVDIFLSHDAPDTNDLGQILEGRWAGENAGNHILATYLHARKPKFAFCGHIHSGNHNFEKVNDIWMANVSYVNENYSPVNPVLVLDIDDYTKELRSHVFMDCNTQEIY